jgi:hypothetical protein
MNKNKRCEWCGRYLLVGALVEKIEFDSKKFCKHGCKLAWISKTYKFIAR